MQATRAIIKTKKDESAGKLLMKLDQMGVTARITKNEPGRSCWQKDKSMKAR